MQVWVWSLKAMTVFYIGLLLLWFKPFNGSFHLKALVGVFARPRLVCGVMSDLVTYCPLEARASHCASAVAMTIVFRFFVLWLDVHETFRSTSLCVHPATQTPVSQSDAGFKDPIRFWNWSAWPVWGIKQWGPNWFHTATVMTLSNLLVCSCEELWLNIWALHFSSLAPCTKPSCKTGLSSGFPSYIKHHNQD